MTRVAKYELQVLVGTKIIVSSKEKLLIEKTFISNSQLTL